MNARRMAAGCAVGAALLLVAGFLLLFSNPSVDVAATDYGLSGPAGEVECSINPLDAGTNGNRNGPGGEHLRPFYDEVATECYAANIVRYNAGIGSGALALVVLAAGLVAAGRSRRPAAAPG